MVMKEHRIGHPIKSMGPCGWPTKIARILHAKLELQTISRRSIPFDNSSVRVTGKREAVVI